MAQIENKSAHSIGIWSREFSKVVRSKSTAEIPDDVARAWVEKPDPSAMIRMGLVEVFFSVAREEDEVATPLEAPAKIEGFDISEIRATPFRDAVEMVERMTDLDALLALHSQETRKKVLSAIESRMEILREG
jgi:hypothetical protein